MNDQVIVKKRGEAFTLTLLTMEVSDKISLQGFQAFINYPQDAITIARDGIAESDIVKAKEADITIHTAPGQVKLGALIRKALIVSGEVPLFAMAGSVKADAEPGLHRIEFDVDESFCLEPAPAPGQEGKDIPTKWQGHGIEVPEVHAEYKLTVYLRIV